MALLDDFLVRFPEIDASTANTLVPVYEEIYPCYYGGNYENACDKNAILFLVAHLVVTDPSVDSDATSRSVSAQTVDGVSETFDSVGNISMKEAWLGSTRYGQMYLALISKNAGVRFL